MNLEYICDISAQSSNFTKPFIYPLEKHIVYMCAHNSLKSDKGHHH